MKIITELDIVEPIMTTKHKKEIKGYKISTKIQFVVLLIVYIFCPFTLYLCFTCILFFILIKL